ncbi:hypothetical protein EMIT0232MI5_30214 [Pseudomonas sp. IT-232MI5]
MTIDDIGHKAENMMIILFLSKGIYAPAPTFPHCRMLAASRPERLRRIFQRCRSPYPGAAGQIRCGSSVTRCRSFFHRSGRGARSGRLGFSRVGQSARTSG